jgi:hypothetical protein
MWYYLATGLIVVLLIVFYLRQGRRSRGLSEDRTSMETSAELGIPPEAIGDDSSFGVDRPKAAASEEEEHFGAMKDLPLKTDSLSKEVELAWEASGTIEFQPGAWALPRDFIDFYENEHYELPQDYGKDKVVLLPRDPRWVYAYWEITHEKYQDMYKRHLEEWGLSRPVLRIYDLSDREGRPKDITLSETAREWYIELDKPNHTYMAEIGRLFEPDLFVPLAFSNQITLPADTFSEKTSAEWEPIQGDYYGSYAYADSSPIAWGKHDE